MHVDVELFFDLSSPWTRLAFHNLPRLLRDTPAAIRLRPFLVGGVFNAVNTAVYAGRANASDHRVQLNYTWLREWAELAGVAMNFPSPHHPLKSVHAMRFCCALEDRPEALRRFAEAAFEAYFADQRNLDAVEELVAVADACGLDGAALAASAATPEIKDRLRSATQEAIDRGAYGSPTIFVGGTHLYFGNDQLPLVRQRVLALAAAATPAG